MSARGKTILAVGLALGSVGVWAPQVAGESAGAHLRTGEPVAEDPSLLASPPDGGPGSPPDGRRPAASAPEATATVDDLAAALRHAEERLPRADSSGGALAALVAELRGASAAPEPRPDPGPSARPATASDPLRASAAAAEAALDAVVAASPLRAVVHGPGDARALLGSRIVRVGDPLGGGVEVAEIGPGRVRLAAGAAERVVALPPFVATGRYGGAGEAEPQETARVPEPAAAREGGSDG